MSVWRGKQAHDAPSSRELGSQSHSPSAYGQRKVSGPAHVSPGVTDALSGGQPGASMLGHDASEYGAPLWK